MASILKTLGEEYHAKRDNRDRENEIEAETPHLVNGQRHPARADWSAALWGARTGPQNKRVGPRENRKPERLLMQESPHPYFG